MTPIGDAEEIEAHVSCLSLCVKYLRKPPSLLQLPHELLSGRLRATIYIPGVSLNIRSCFQFQTKMCPADLPVENFNLKSCRTVAALSQRRGSLCETGADRLAKWKTGAARTGFAANLQLLLMLLSVLCRLLQGEEDSASS